MKKVGIILLLFFGGLIVLSTIDNTKQSDHKENVQNQKNETEKWYQGGSLHKASIGEWKSASYQNKLATSGDWLAATVWKGHLNSMSSFEELKIQAIALVIAIDKTIEGKQFDEFNKLKVNEIAASITFLSKDFGP